MIIPNFHTRVQRLIVAPTKLPPTVATPPSDPADGSSNVSVPTRIFDYVLLTASLAFAEEFRIDCERRMASEDETEVRAIIVAQRSVEAELDELESRVARIQRSLTVAVVEADAFAVVQAHALLDIRRISVALARVHRSLLTLYPVVTAQLIEQTRSFQVRLESALSSRLDAHPDWLTILLEETLELSFDIREEIV